MEIPMNMDDLGPLFLVQHPVGNFSYQGELWQFGEFFETFWAQEVSPGERRVFTKNQGRQKRPIVQKPLVCRLFFVFSLPPQKKLTWLAGISTMNESMYFLLKSGWIFPAIVMLVIFRGLGLKTVGGRRDDPIFRPTCACEQRKKPWLVGLYRDYTTQLYRGYFINHEIRIPINHPV